MSRFTAPAKKKLDVKNLSFIILAAGECKKYKIKSLFKIDSLTLIEYQIREIREAFGSSIDIIVVLGYEFEKIYKYIPRGVRVIENFNYLNNTSATSLLMGLRACITDNVYMSHGDILFNRELFKLSIAESHTFGWRLEKDSGAKPGIICQNDEVKHLQYGLDIQWGQIVLLTEKDVNQYKISYTKHKETQPQIFEVFNDMLDSGMKMKYIPSELKEITSGKDLL